MSAYFLKILQIYDLYFIYCYLWSMKRVFFLIAILLLQTVSAPASDKLKLSTVVIDAGHGGKDPGCVSSDK